MCQRLLEANLVELNRAPCQSCAPVKVLLEAGGRLRHNRGHSIGTDCHLTLIEQVGPTARASATSIGCRTSLALRVISRVSRLSLPLSMFTHSHRRL